MLGERPKPRHIGGMQLVALVPCYAFREKLEQYPYLHGMKKNGRRWNMFSNALEQVCVASS